MARGWKLVVERGIARSGLARLVERRRRPAVVVLAYHNIVPSGEKAVGDRSLHVDQAVFAEQLDWLAEGRRIVSLEDAARPSEIDETRIVVTFDDAYLGAMTAGVEELAKRGHPSTVFVPPGLLGSAGFWWDLLSGPRGLDERVREHALGELRGETDRILAWASEEGLPLQEVADHARPVHTEALADAPTGVSFGAHTWSHPNLARLALEESTLELRRSKEWLQSRTDRFVDWLAYPYGLLSPVAVRAVEEVFEGAFLVAGGPAALRGRWVGRPYRIPRINVPRGMSIDGLALRLAALVGGA